MVRGCGGMGGAGARRERAAAAALLPRLFRRLSARAAPSRQCARTLPDPSAPTQDLADIEAEVNGMDAGGGADKGAKAEPPAQGEGAAPAGAAEGGSKQEAAAEGAKEENKENEAPAPKEAKVGGCQLQGGLHGGLCCLEAHGGHAAACGE
jgi:hypothetical protein